MIFLIVFMQPGIIQFDRVWDQKLFMFVKFTIAFIKKKCRRHIQNNKYYCHSLGE